MHVIRQYSALRNCQTVIFRSNIFDVVTSNMSNRIEYLMKYSVAPPPSRDYYGLKIFQDEIILYLWKISHGPRKTPIVHRVTFTEFNQEKSLQDEITSRIIGKYLLEHVKNIAEGHKKTLLTLSISLIGKISKCLQITDIIKLFSLSCAAYEVKEILIKLVICAIFLLVFRVFNTNLIWQILYTRDKRTKINLKEKEKILVYGWKQLYKDKQMQSSIKNQKNLRISSSNTNNAKTIKLLKSINNASKSISNTTSTIDMSKKCSDLSMDLITIPLSKTISDTQFQTYTKNEKPLPQKKNIKNFTFNVNEKNVKKDLVISRMTKKQKNENISKRNEICNKQINQTEKYSNKNNNINTKLVTSTQENKLKSKKSQIASKPSLSKNTIRNVKSSSVLTSNLSNDIRSKIKNTPKKKIVAIKSETFNTDKKIPENPFVDDGFNLADLIEASLKNIRSPRSIFDYDFSYMQQAGTTRDILKIRNEIQNIDKLNHLKSSKSNVFTHNFSNKIIHGDGLLEKLSEKSEPLSEPSTESLVNNKKSILEGDNKPFSLSEKYIKARTKLRKSLDCKQSDSTSSQTRWNPNLEYINFQNKSFKINPKIIDNNNEKSFKESLKTTFLAKTNNSN
ncbi:uncharacterized protein MAL13P1.304-like, partial [Pogonomyrmex barbatus]|uniref:Uncharacterized protein MAL13P1.304-like n=1 Tax=Pogonomyrmex barbatus TaxID=144034 RepID=A0A8N1S5M8_9HYME